MNEEKQLLLSFKTVMQKFLHDHIDLQVAALYALQVHCNTKGFPKGMYTHLLLSVAAQAQVRKHVKVWLRSLMITLLFQVCCCATL